MKKSNDKKSNVLVIVISGCIGAIVGIIAYMNDWL